MAGAVVSGEVMSLVRFSASSMRFQLARPLFMVTMRFASLISSTNIWDM